MPELPEVEHLRRTIAPDLIEGEVRSVTVHRRDVVASKDGDRTGRLPHRTLLVGATIVDLRRRGKQLAIIGDQGGSRRALVVQLGMTGQLMVIPQRTRVPDSSHVHITWRLRSARQEAHRLVFRDVRRFGGLTVLPSVEALEERWNQLGPDALDITPAELRDCLASTKRTIKAALLDQNLIAGIGNIYADESLFASRISPTRCVSTLKASETGRLARVVRSILRAAIHAGGSTLRDYVDGTGAAGSHQNAHQVYGRAGHPCTRCGRSLEMTSIAQRTTVYCSGCQT